MALLSWITDEQLKLALGKLIDAVKKGKKKAEKDFSRNVVDPFAATLTMSLFGLAFEQWKHTELHRQAEKSLTNAVGGFHQNVLGSIRGWEDLHTSNQVDIVNHERKIIAEIKNKYNTLNAGGVVALYKRLNELVNNKSSYFKGYTAYYVTIIPRTPEGIDTIFAPSDNATGERCKYDDKIRAIDGLRFYALASGSSTAFPDLYKVLHQALHLFNIPYLSAMDRFFLQDLFSKAFVP